jgi:UDP-N-acetylmuramoyl-tripeptide--D-alanyl-D-alanine ligase
MITELRLTDAAVAYGGTLLNPDCTFNDIAIDSRKISQGDLFVALKGERFDAHQFLSDIADKASGLVVSAADKSLNLPQWVVEDTTQALGQLARMQRDQFDGLLIAITGSNGKTSVKEMVSSILRQSKSVHATTGNLNNHIGVPLTLLSMQADTEVAVIEMGASGAGDINYLCDVAKPHVALINNIQHAHIEGFGSIEGVASAKAEIYEGLVPSGTAVVNIDLPWSQKWLNSLEDKQIIRFSLDQTDADFYAENIEILSNGCCRFDLCQSGDKEIFRQVVEMPIPGIHSVKNALAAAACTAAVGIDIKQIAAGLIAFEPVAGRLKTIQLTTDIKLIDDTYNANPDSFNAAIDVLRASAGYRVLIMGDMAELGDRGVELHQQVGDYASECGIDAMCTVGILSSVASDQFGGSHYESKEALVADLMKSIRNHQSATILVKGSRSAGMEKVVELLSNWEMR